MMSTIGRLDPEWFTRAAAYQARLTMPTGALGRLLELGQLLCAVQERLRPRADPAAVVVAAADHGVAAEGVSAYPPEVTGQMVANYLRGGAAVNVLARRVGAAVRVVDLGVAHPVPTPDPPPAFHSRPIRAGTWNFLDGPAMTRDEAFRAVQIGLDLGSS